MSKRQDDIAIKAKRKSTLKSLKAKKDSRLSQLKRDYEEKVRQVNLQYTEDPERLNAKYAAEDYARSEKAKKRAEKRIARARSIIETDKKTRKLTTAEEIATSILQGIGACLFIAGLATLETIAIQKAEHFITLTTVIYALYGSAMILTLFFSLMSHALTRLAPKVVFNRLSHVFAFLVIGFTYSAFAITKIQGTKGWILFGIVWGLVLIGTLFYAISGRKHLKLNIILSSIAGFSGVVVGYTLYSVLPQISFTMIVCAAVFYLIGIILYSVRKIRFVPFIGAVFLLAGDIYIFFSLFFMNI